MKVKTSVKKVKKVKAKAGEKKPENEK